MLRACADGIAADDGRTPAALAQAILDEVAEREEVGPSLGSDQCAAAAVASLVSSDHGAALRWVQQFLDHPETDPADIEWLSDLVRNAWREDQATIVDALDQRRSMHGPRPSIEVSQLAPTNGLEAVLREPSFVTAQWLKAGSEAALSVVCIRERENIIATGFVLRGGDLREQWGDEIVLLANSYVIAVDPAIRDQLAFSVPPVASIRAQFTANSSSDLEYRIGEVLFSSPPHELDVTVCRLDPPAIGVNPLRVAAALPLPDGQRPVMLIGHPGGRGLQLSLEGRLLDHDNHRLHYTAPAEAGSSGRPVFNRFWQVIGIHHAGDRRMPRLHGKPGIYAADEGSSILAIIKALAPP